MHKNQITALRRKLPTRGYASAIRKTAENRVSIEQVKNFFMNRPVNDDAVDIILDATKKFLKNRKSKADKRRNKIKATLKAA